MTDRIPTKPGRVLIVPEGGAQYYATVTQADEPYELGTPWAKEAVLTDPTAAALGLIPENNPTPNDAFLEIANTIQILNRTYPGQDLQEKFSAEIFNHYPTPWEWAKDRINMAFFRGLNVGDYIPWQSTNGYNFKQEIMGIDTYYNYGDTPTPHHIDWGSRDCWPDPIQMNLVNYNNGTSVSPYPWLASNLYAKLNSLQMQVPNSATVNPTLTTVDYRNDGIYDKLPAAMKGVISPKRVMLPRRYTAGSLLLEDNGWGWQDIGYLWPQAESEVDREHWGSKNGYSSGGFQQYPIFANNMKRIKGAGDGGARTHWWSLSAMVGSSTHCANIHTTGYAANSSASNASIHTSVNFRITA